MRESIKASVRMQPIVKLNLRIAILIGFMILCSLSLPPGVALALDHKSDSLPGQLESKPSVTPQNPVDTTQTQAAEFTLKDQHNRIHHYRFPREKASVLLMADQEGSGQLEDWIRPIYAHFQHQVEIDGVAELSKVPRWVRGLVRTFFRGQLDYPVMLDWSGTIASLYNYQPGQANLFVIDSDGDITLRVFGPVSDTKLKTVFSSLEPLTTLLMR